MSDKNRIRLELELTRVGDRATPLINLFTGRSPQLPRSRAIQLEIVLLINGALDPAVANITSLVCEVKTYNSPTSAPLISKSLVAIDIDSTVTDADRAAYTKQHALVNFLEGDTGLDMTGANTLNNKNFSLVITATRNGYLTTLADGLIVFHNDGGQYSGNTPTAGDPTYLTRAETMGLLADFLKIFNDPGVPLILKSPDGTLQRRLGVDNYGTRTDDVSPAS